LGIIYHRRIVITILLKQFGGSGGPIKQVKQQSGQNPFSDTSRWFVLKILGAAVEGYKREEQWLYITSPILANVVINMAM
jgi:hypothetical protein